MPIKNTKKTNICCSGITKDNIKKGIDEVKKLITQAKDKYESADEKTKKKVVAGVVGAAAILAGAIGLKAIKKKMKK
ncbi:MAG: hypothetical protein ABIE43_05550 [Patescibacteria group bacterium]